MYRRVALTIALAASVISLALLSSDSSSKADSPIRPVDSGYIRLGANQLLRATVVNRGKADSRLRFKKTEYSQVGCIDGVCKHEILTEQATPVITLPPGAAVSFDIAGNELTHGVRAMAYLDYTDDFCMFAIIDSPTGAIVSTLLGTTYGGSGEQPFSLPEN